MAFVRMPPDPRSVSSWRCWIGGDATSWVLNMGDTMKWIEMAILNGENDAKPSIVEVPYSQTNPFLGCRKLV